MGYSMPVFWLGLMGLLLFYGQLEWVGGPGRLDIFYEGIVPSVTGILTVDALIAGDWEIFRNALSHLILPASIHGQTTRMDQLDDLKTLGIVPSLFPMHTFYWGDWHRDSVLGPRRAEIISPCHSAIRRGMRFTTHHDAPVANPDSMRVLSATVTRYTSDSGSPVTFSPASANTASGLANTCPTGPSR